ncbi:MAG: hypothetical protein AAGK74_21860 [Chloroflexota bacterium]
MSDFEEWRKKIRETAISDPEEILRIMREKAVDDPTFVLELRHDKNDNTILLQGNEAGLNYLAQAILRMVNSGVPGSHAHFEAGHGFTESDLHLIVQRVDDAGHGGAHQVTSSDD